MHGGLSKLACCICLAWSTWVTAKWFPPSRPCLWEHLVKVTSLGWRFVQLWLWSSSGLCLFGKSHHLRAKKACLSMTVLPKLVLLASWNVSRHHRDESYGSGPPCFVLFPLIIFLPRDRVHVPPLPVQWQFSDAAFLCPVLQFDGYNVLSCPSVPAVIEMHRCCKHLWIVLCWIHLGRPGEAPHCLASGPQALDHSCLAAEQS